MSKRLALLSALTLPLLCGAVAHAAPVLQLRLSDGTTTQTITGDAGVAVYAPASFGTFDIVSALGTGSPLGTPLSLIDLSSVQIASSSAGMLTLELTETGLTSSHGGLASSFFSAIGGTLGPDNTLTYATYVDGTNAAFGTQQLLSRTTFSGAIPFAGSSTDIANPGSDLFSETEVITLNAAARTTTSFDARINEVPEPASMALLGAGLLGLGFARRRRG